MSKAFTELVPRSRPRSIGDLYADPGAERSSVITAHRPLLPRLQVDQTVPNNGPRIPNHAIVSHGRCSLYCRSIAVLRATKARGPGQVPGPLFPSTVVRGLRLLRSFVGFLLDVLELGPVDDTFGVVGQRAGLQADDVFALDRVYNREVRRIDDKLLVDHVGVLPAVGVLQIDLVAVLQVLQVVEREVAPRPWKPDAVTSDVHVGRLLPREPRGIEVYAGVVVKQLLIRTEAGRDGVVLDPLHRRDRELETLLLGRLDQVLAVSSVPLRALLRGDLLALGLVGHLLGRPLLLGVFFLRLLLRIFLLGRPPLVAGGLARGRTGGERHNHRQDRQYEHQISRTHHITSRSPHKIPYLKSVQNKDYKTVTFGPKLRYKLRRKLHTQTTLIQPVRT